MFEKGSLWLLFIEQSRQLKEDIEFESESIDDETTDFKTEIDGCPNLECQIERGHLREVEKAEGVLESRCGQTYPPSSDLSAPGYVVGGRQLRHVDHVDRDDRSVVTDIDHFSVSFVMSHET